MNCQFCHQPCYLTNSIEFVESWVGSYPNQIWECNKHPHSVKQYIKFVYDRLCNCNGKENITHIKCCPKEQFYKTIVEYQYKDYSYLAIWCHDDNTFYLQKIISDSQRQQALNVIKLDFIPKELSPENIDKRLPTWVAFS